MGVTWDSEIALTCSRASMAVEKGLNAARVTILEKRAMSVMLSCTLSVERPTASTSLTSKSEYPEAVSKSTKLTWNRRGTG